ncbi:MAG: V-type ATPase V1 subunit C [Amphiamblys sp. WSBS2006]|nr:MAG: V-type ATPase V1 subunit C [Amphiamblys sp. WSBS2006]
MLCFFGSLFAEGGEREAVKKKIEEREEKRRFGVQFLEFPSLSPGSLDNLLLSGDSMAELATSAGKMVARIAAVLRDELAGEDDDEDGVLLVDGRKAAEYVRSFAWCHSRYIQSKTVSSVCSQLKQEAEALGRKIQKNMAGYTEKKSLHQRALARQRALATKRLVGIEDECKGSGYLAKVCVVVPLEKKSVFEGSYLGLCDFVVGGTLAKIEESREEALYTVVVFLKFLDVFRRSAVSAGYRVRGLDEGKSGEPETESPELFQKERLVFLRHLSVDFGELFSCFMHICVVRLFIDSVLTYGLNAEYVPFVVSYRRDGEEKASRAIDAVSLLLPQHWRQVSKPHPGSEDSPEEHRYVRYDFSV